MPICSNDLSVDHYLWRRNPSTHLYELRIHFQLWFLNQSDCHLEESPIFSKQVNIDKHHPLLESPSKALNDYVKVPEPHSNSLQLHILGELLDFLFWEDILSKMAHTHLAYPDLALDKFSGTDPDQDAEAFIRLIECKNNFALGTEPDEANAEHIIYLFRKKAFFPHC